MRRLSKSQPRHVVQYRILDSKRGLPRRGVTVHASVGEMKHLVEEGFLVREGLLSRSLINRFRTALEAVLEAEAMDGRPSADGCFGSPYLRHLIDKHELF